MRRAIARRTVYAMTLISVLALAGAWTFAATVVVNPGPSQRSSITVVPENPLTFVSVQSVSLVPVDYAIANDVLPAGVAAGTGTALNSTFDNALLSCGTPPCNNNYSAVEVTNQAGGPVPLVLEDWALQVSLEVQQPATASGFDIVAVFYLTNSGNSATSQIFANGYFDTGVQAGTGIVWVMLFADSGFSLSGAPPVVDNTIITMNACQQATTCP